MNRPESQARPFTADRLNAALHEVGSSARSPYLDDIVARAHRTRQRPAWTFPERWLPMVDIARQPVIAPRLPLRSVGLGLLIIGLILAVVALIAVGSPPSPPPPFGPAGNGAVAYAADGDIFTVAGVGSEPMAVVSGPEWDQDPKWSLDGSRLGFLRKAHRAEAVSTLFVALADGSHVTGIPLEPSVIDSFVFSPDGGRILISAQVRGRAAILIAPIDASPVRQIDIGRPVAHASWRPPVGDEVLFTDYGIDGPGYGGIYVMRPDGGPIRTILPSADGRSRGLVGWSPDGTRIAYSEWTDADDLTVRTHIINADGTGDRVLALPSGAVWEDPVAWSNDGTRLVSIRGYDGGNSRSRAVARPVDGNETGIEIAYPGVINQGCCSAWEWAPDDTSILGTPTDVGGWPLQQVKLDPKTGTTSDVSWSTTSAPTWQRLARTK
jgi:hypothetical protein